MKQKLLNSIRLRAMMLVAVMCAAFAGQAWADTYTWTTASGQLSTSTTSFTVNEVAWSFTPTWSDNAKKYVSWIGGSTNCYQIGSSKNILTALEISTSDITRSITSVDVIWSSCAANSASLAVSVGASSFTSTKATSSSSTLQTSTYTGTGTGTLTLSFTCTTGIKLQKVIVTYAASSDPSSNVAFTNTAPTLDLKNALTYSQVPTTAAGYSGTISYEMTANTAGATINASTGVVSPTQAGSVTVKATAAAVPGYFSSSSASYTLAVSDSRASAGLAWSAASADVTYDSDSNVFPTLTNPNGVTVSYSSSNTSAATINSTTGVITLKNVNENTTIKATFAGDATYKSQEVFYTLNVSKAPFAVKDGVFDFVSAAEQEPLEDYGSGMTLTTSAYTTTDNTWTAVNVTMVTSKGSGSGLRWWKSDGTLRFYNGAKATFSVPSGYYITKIVTTGANFNSANVGTLSGATWTGVSKEVELSVDGTRNIKTITVTYVSETQTVTLNAYGYATFACSGPLDFTDSETNGYSAWQITGINGSTISFGQITGTVKAGTGVLLKGKTSASINIPVVASGTDISATNKLKGITAATDVAAEKYYGLKGNAFVPVNAGTVPAGKALLPASVVDASVKAFTFVFEDETTGISTVAKGQEPMANGQIFNLAGQRMSKLQKGVNIVNGKKVLVK